jgi:hypothetical protein
MNKIKVGELLLSPAECLWNIGKMSRMDIQASLLHHITELDKTILKQEKVLDATLTKLAEQTLELQELKKPKPGNKFEPIGILNPETGSVDILRNTDITALTLVYAVKE